MTELAQHEARVSVAGFETGTSGVTPPSGPPRHGAFLADVIVDLGFADREVMEHSVEAAARGEMTIERYLLERGVLDEEQLSLAIAERNGLDHVDLGRFALDAEAAQMVGRAVAVRYRTVPIAFAADGALIVAVEDPFDTLGISDIEVMTKCETRQVIATPSGIRAAIERLPEEPRRAAASPPQGNGHEMTPESPPEGNGYEMTPESPPQGNRHETASAPEPEPGMPLPEKAAQPPSAFPPPEEAFA